MIVRTIFCVLVSALCVGMANAQSTDARGSDDAGRFSVRAGMGFTSDPETFLTGFDFSYALRRDWEVGLLLQIGAGDRKTLVAPTINTRFYPDFGLQRSKNDFVRGLRPFLHGGLGLMHYDLDLPNRRDADDTEFLMNMGVGADFQLNEHFSVGTQMTFNVIPDGVFGDKFVYSWQLATATYRF